MGSIVTSILERRASAVTWPIASSAAAIRAFDELPPAATVEFLRKGAPGQYIGIVTKKLRAAVFRSTIRPLATSTSTKASRVASMTTR
jgi:hypothetical protein